VVLQNHKKKAQTGFLSQILVVDFEKNHIFATRFMPLFTQGNYAGTLN
jgi:hypothetical protein